MARPIFQHELSDQDFQWLMSTYKEAHPNIAVVESTCLPIVLILLDEPATVALEEASTSDVVSALPVPDATTAAAVKEPDC